HCIAVILYMPRKFECIRNRWLSIQCRLTSRNRRSVGRSNWGGRELGGVGNADRHADFSASMKERNFIRKEKFGRRCRRQDENSERHDSTQNLGERRCRFFRLFGL